MKNGQGEKRRVCVRRGECNERTCGSVLLSPYQNHTASLLTEFVLTAPFKLGVYTRCDSTVTDHACSTPWPHGSSPSRTSYVPQLSPLSMLGPPLSYECQCRDSSSLDCLAWTLLSPQAVSRVLPSHLVLHDEALMQLCLGRECKLPTLSTCSHFMESVTRQILYHFNQEQRGRVWFWVLEWNLTEIPCNLSGHDVSHKDLPCAA
jgi:hypothetical protein